MPGVRVSLKFSLLLLRECLNMMNGNFINYIDIILTIDILYHRVLKNFQVFMKNLMFIYEKFNFYK